MTGMTFKSPLSVQKITRIKEALAGCPMTSRQLADTLHADRSGTCVYLRHLQDIGEVYIKLYEVPREGGRAKPVYALGKGKSPPEPIHTTTRSARRNARIQWMKKHDPAGYLDALMKQRAYEARRRLAAKRRAPATWLDALAA
jgi:hypothetical protein